MFYFQLKLNPKWGKLMIKTYQRFQWQKNWAGSFEIHIPLEDLGKHSAVDMKYECVIYYSAYALLHADLSERTFLCTIL